MSAKRNKVIFLLKGYPRLSETFIAQEIRALEQKGLDLALVSLRHPTDKHTHPIHAEIKAPVRYLPEYLHQEPWRVLRCWWKARRLPGYKAARAVWLRDLKRDVTRNRIRRFGQALVLAAELPADAAHLHAHFLHTPASVARYVSVLTGLPWSFSAHAKDIWTTPEWEKQEKLADAAWGVTCTKTGYDHLLALHPKPQQLMLVYHGLDLTRFPPPLNTPPHQGVTILSVGRAVEKKGFDDLIAALAHIPHDIDWRWVHIGGGPLLPKLQEMAKKSPGIADRIIWQGALPQEKVLEAYRTADIFVLPSRVADDGDRDGLPNVLMEAQSQKLPVISTFVGGVAELIEHGVTGLLTEPGNVLGLAELIAQLARDPARRRALGEAGFARVHDHFDMRRQIDGLAAKFNQASPCT